MNSNSPAHCMSYPIVIRILKEHIEVSQPDLDIYRIKGRFDEIKRAEELGSLILEVWKEVIVRLKTMPIPFSSPREAVQKTEYLTTGEVAEILSVSRNTVRRMCDSRSLEFFETAGGHRKIKRSSLPDRPKISSKP